MKSFLYISLFVLIVSSCKKIDIKTISKVGIEDLSINSTKAIVNNVVVDYPEGNEIYYGNCWAINEYPTIDNQFSKYGPNPVIGNYYDTLSNLVPGTKYYVRPYSFDGVNYVYADGVEFQVSSSEVNINLNTLSVVTEESIQVGGSINDLGSLKAIDYGICWSDSVLPTIHQDILSLGAINEDALISELCKDLDFGKRYVFRTYVKFDESNIMYSDSLSIYISNYEVLTLGFNSSSNPIELSGEVTELGVTDIVQHGHCWSATTSTPSVNDSKSELGSKLTKSEYTSTMSGVSSGLTYYYRAYVSNGSRVVYGSIKSITVP